MTLNEFQAWKAFYVNFPFDDLHRYHRPAAMVAAAWGGKFAERLEFLSPKPVVEEPVHVAPGRYSAADLSVINTMMKFVKGK